MTDCWILGRGTSLHAIHYQRISILFRWCQGGFCSRIHFTLDGHGKPFSLAYCTIFVLMLAQIVWIIYFGSTPRATHRSYIDSFALHKEQRASTRNSRPMSPHFANGPETTHTGDHAPQMYTSAQLNGFETSSPVSAYPGGPVGQQAQPRFGQGGRSDSPAGQTPTTAAPMGSMGEQHDPRNDVTSPTEYQYRAKAICSYEANPDDANEISFSKHEILEVSDVSGRWWQAKKNTGETGKPYYMSSSRRC